MQHKRSRSLRSRSLRTRHSRALQKISEPLWPKRPKLATWITREALRSLRDLAAAHQVTVGQVAADILARGLKERAETAGLGFLGPAVQGVVKREVGRMSDRLAHLMARSAPQSATARRLVFQILVRVDCDWVAWEHHDHSNQ